jgi:hypothetical protein
MARRRNEFFKLAEQLEAGFLAPFILGVARSAQAVVTELQEAGPAWSGKFSNSWEIATASQVSSGSGAEGAPQRLQAPILTPEQFKFKPEIKYYIANKSPYADVALDLKEGNFEYPGKEPRTKATRGTRLSGFRGDLSGTEGPNRSTAPLDWYRTYIQGGGLDKAINLYMQESLRDVRL